MRTLLYREMLINSARTRQWKRGACARTALSRCCCWLCNRPLLLSLSLKKQTRNTFCVFSVVDGWGRAFFALFSRAPVTHVTENYTEKAEEQPRGGTKSCPGPARTYYIHTSVRSEENERRSETKQTRREDGVRQRRCRQRQQRRRRLTEATNRKTVACSVLFRSLSLCVVVKRRKRHEKNRLINYCQLNGKYWVNNRVNYFKKASVNFKRKRIGKIKWKTKVKAQQPQRRGENFVVSQNMA